MTDFTALATYEESTRFWDKVEPSGDCWDWTAVLTEKGYGLFTVNKRNFRAHRISYQILVGSIPKGRVIDHLCRNRRCVNPDHLEPVTTQENTRRGSGSKKELCPTGHRYTEENTKYRTKRGYTYRVCRECEKRWA